MLVVGLAAGWLLIGQRSKGLPSIDWARHYRPPIVTEVWSGDEQLIGEYSEERRKVVPYDRIPKKLVQAFIASEDKDFFDHGGVSFSGLLRGIYKTYVRRNRTAKAKFGLKRMFLHAPFLALPHPITGKRLQFHVPMPEELQAALARAKIEWKPPPGAAAGLS